MENQNAAKTRSAASRNVRTLVECAILIALSFVLSQFTIIELPNGGSITPLSMVPVCLIGFLHGPKWGFGSAFVYSILCLFSGRVFSWGLTPVVLIVCILADYIFAFTVLGITGLFKNKGTKGILIGTFLAVFLRFCFTSGIVIIHIIFHSLLEFRRREEISVMVERVGGQSDSQDKAGGGDAEAGFGPVGHMLLPAS